MKEKRYRLIRNLLVYLMVIGMVFNFPITHVRADGDETPEPVSMVFSWPEGKNGEVVVDVSGGYDDSEILNGGKLTVTYSDESVKEFICENGDFTDGENYLYISHYDNTWETNWVVGVDNAVIVLEYNYDDYSREPLKYEVPITIVEDPEIISWEDAKTSATELKFGEELSLAGKTSFVISNYGDYKQKGTLVYVDVPYKKEIVISTDTVFNYTLLKDAEGTPKLIQYGDASSVTLRNCVAESIRYYISLNVSDDSVTGLVFNYSSSDLKFFEDVKDKAITLTEGKNINEASDYLKWITGDDDYYLENEMRVGKIVIPPGKAIRFDWASIEYDYIVLPLFGDDGDTTNYDHQITLANDYTKVDDVVGGILANSGTTDKVYYFIYDDGINEIDISYTDFADVTITIDPNYPDDLNKDEYDKKIQEIYLDESRPYIRFNESYFGNEEKYAISGWKNKDTGIVYSAEFIFYPEEDVAYNFEAIWTEKPYVTLTFKSNYRPEWNLEEEVITYRVYDGSSVYISDIGINMPRKDGYKVSEWYYIENDEKVYKSSWYEPEEDMVFYAEWEETDEVKVTFHSNYPEELELSDVEYFEYVSPSEYYYGNYEIEIPEFYQITGWKDKNGNDREIQGYFTENTDFYAQWKKLNKVTFHSNYPEILGKENETDTEVDYGDGVNLNWRFNADGDYQGFVFISGWSKTIGGQSVGAMDSAYYPTEDTDLYAIWTVPEMKTYTFHSNYPESWNKEDVTATMTEKPNGYINIMESAVPDTIIGKNGVTIVGWEDADGFRIYRHPTDFQGMIWYSSSDWYAVWSTRPKVTIYTNLPNAYSEVAGSSVSYYSNRANQFNPYSFDVVNSVEGYNCKLVDRVTKNEYVIGETTEPIQLTEDMIFDAQWSPAESIYLHTAYSDGSPYYLSLKCLWEGGYNLPSYYYTDPSTGEKWTTSWYVDASGNKYYTGETVQIPDQTELWAVFDVVKKSNVTYYFDYPGGTPDGYSESYQQETYNGTYSINSSLRNEMAAITGYTFIGWIDANGNMVDETGTYSTDEDIVLHGVWKSQNNDGFVKEGTLWKYYVNGDLYKVDEKKGKTLVYGTIDGKKNWYKVDGKGVYDPSFTGIALDTDNKWFFVKSGVKDIAYNGIAQATNSIWYYVEKGVINRNFSGKIVKATNGNWYYVNKGKPTKTFTGKIAQRTDNQWYYCTNGRPDVNTSGIIAYCTNGNWYYVKKGKIYKSFTGVAKATNGNWYYCKNGVMNKSFTGIAKGTDGKYYYVKKGVMNKSFTGIAKGTDGKYYYVNKGKQDLKYKGIAKMSNGKMYYVSKGFIDRTFSGKCKYNGKTYTVVKGVVK